MKKKLLSAMTVAMILLAITQSAIGESYYSSIDWASSYILNSGFSTYNKPVVQTFLSREFENGFGISLFNSLPASAQYVGDNTATEGDLNGWYRHGFARFGLAYIFMFPDKDTFYKNDVWQINAEISKEFQMSELKVTPGFRMEYDLPVDGTYNRQTTGIYLIPRINLASQLNDKLSFNLMTKFEIDAGGYGADKALIIFTAPKFSYAITKNLTTNVGINMYFPTIKSERDIRKNQYVTDIGISYAF